MDPRGGFGDNAAGTIRGDVPMTPPRSTLGDAPPIREPQMQSDLGDYQEPGSIFPENVPDYLEDISGDRYARGGDLYDPNQAHGQLPFEHEANAGLWGPDDTMAVQDSYAGVFDVDGQPMGTPTNEMVDPTYGYASNAIDEMKNPTPRHFRDAGDLPVVHPDFDQEILGEFEKLIGAGVSPEEAIDVIALQYGDLLQGDIWF